METPTVRLDLRGNAVGNGVAPMTADEFAEALSRLVGEAEDAGLDPQKILAEIEGMAEALRVCVQE